MAVILPELGPLADFKFARMAHSPCESSFLSFPLRNKFSGAMMAGPYENSTCICSIFLALRRVYGSGGAFCKQRCPSKWDAGDEGVNELGNADSPPQGEQQHT